MLVGVPKEIKTSEYRVGLVPSSVRELIVHGHQVLVQKNAGQGIGCTNDDYRKTGAEIADSLEEVYAKAELIVKVKEPQPSEIKLLKKGQMLFAYLHLAPDLAQTEGLLASGCIAIAYETVTGPHGSLPLLLPMSEVAGRLSVQVGAYFLQEPQGGSGILLGGVPGVEHGHVVIIGAGVVGTNAARIAVGYESMVTVLNRSLDRLQELDAQFGSKINTILATQATIEEYVLQADLVIGAVLIPGALAPKVVMRDMLPRMRRGSVLVDVAIDQGGCFETSRPTTHQHPTYVVDGVVHYCVANMPGAVPRTSTFALNNATLPFVLALANKGYHQAFLDDPNLLNGLNVFEGHVTYEAVANALSLQYVPAKKLLKHI